MNDQIVTQLLDCFKTVYGLKRDRGTHETWRHDLVSDRS